MPHNPRQTVRCVSMELALRDSANPNPNQATMSLLGALSCSRLRVPLPGLAELRAAGLGTVLCMGVCNAATCFLFMPPPVLTRDAVPHL